LISEKITEHQHAQVLLSMPDFGPVLTAEFLGATGWDLTVFQSVDRFAGLAGLAPAPRDSGRISGNNHPPRRYDRRLLPVFYLSGLSALKSCPASRGHYDGKRGKEKPTSRQCRPLLSGCPRRRMLKASRPSESTKSRAAVSTSSLLNRVFRGA
jgi:transposase